MCVRDPIRRKCQASKRTHKAKLRQSDKVSSKSSNARRARTSGASTTSTTMKQSSEETVDLLCTELLSHIDHPHYYYNIDAFHASESDIPIDDDEYDQPLAALMADIPSGTSSRDMDGTFSLLLSPSDFRLFQHSGSVEGSTVFPTVLAPYDAAEYHRARDHRNWDDEGLIDSVDWHDFSSYKRCNQVPKSPKQNRNASRQMLESDYSTYTPAGSSLQSNCLPYERWPVVQNYRGPSCLEDTAERRSMDSRLNTVSRSRKKLEFYRLQSDTTFPCKLNTISDDHDESISTSTTSTLEFEETMKVLLEKESAKHYQLSESYISSLDESNVGQDFEINNLRATRSKFVNWILKVVELLHLSALTGAHAVSLFDRCMSRRLALDYEDEKDEELKLTATACVWIAAKLEDSCAPNLSSLLTMSAIEQDEEKIRKMEVWILTTLDWRMLGATAADFLANMIAQLPALGMPPHLLPQLGRRSQEIMQGLLSEVEFLAYQPSVVSFSVMQYLLDECVPLHTASLMAAFHLAVDVESLKECHKTLVDLLAKMGSLHSDSLHQTSSYLHSDHPSESQQQLLSRLPISTLVELDGQIAELDVHLTGELHGTVRLTCQQLHFDMPLCPHDIKAQRPTQSHLVHVEMTTFQ